MAVLSHPQMALSLVSKSPVPLDEQQPIDKNLGGHVLRHLYGGETHAELSITVQDRMIQYSLVSELQSANIPDDDLVQAICDLVDLHERFGSGHSSIAHISAVRPHSGSDRGAAYAMTGSLTTSGCSTSAIQTSRFPASTCWDPLLGHG